MYLIGSVSMTKTRDKSLRRRIHRSHMTYMSHYHDRATLLEAYYGSINNTVTMNAARITIPTLLIAGKADAIAPIAGQRKLVALFAHGKLVELDNVGHIIHYEQPAAAAQAIIDFLSPVTTIA
jgi:pimeloyl-ACP methyl ester carboxylesterase